PRRQPPARDRREGHRLADPVRRAERERVGVGPHLPGPPLPTPPSPRPPGEEGEKQNLLSVRRCPCPSVVVRVRPCHYSYRSADDHLPGPPLPTPPSPRPPGEEGEKQRRSLLKPPLSRWAGGGRGRERGGWGSEGLLV